MPVTDHAALSRANGHELCLLCGEDNPWSLRLAFQRDGAGVVRARFRPDRRLQGYRGILHGGVIAALLDAAMTHCLFHHGVQALTADLHVRYAHAVAWDTDLDLSASIVSAREPLYRVRGELAADGQLLAWAEAKFLHRPMA